MADPRHLSIKDFSYSLPEEKIAKYPLTERDASRLLIYQDGKIEESVYRNIARYIPEDSCIIFNNTKVVAARLLFQKASGGIIEIFCLEPHEQYADITSAMLQQEKVLWKCLIGGASKWKQGQLLTKRTQTPKGDIVLTARYIEKLTDAFIVELSWHPQSVSFSELLHYAGAIPLPPYLKRKTELSDTKRYQTVFAEPEGSVAAPTAGLHFTNDILNTLSEKNILSAFVTLHVGAGTFKPVKAVAMNDHEMHTEFIEAGKQFIELLLANSHKTIIATGTTSLRTIESLYWLGVKIAMGQYPATNELPVLEQWEVYDIPEQHMAAETALRHLLEWMKENNIQTLIAKTKILIAPGYKIRIAKGLITNFHQPQSTLLLLVAACIGNNWKSVYNYALDQNFRFLSYGDGSLLWIN